MLTWGGMTAAPSSEGSKMKYIVLDSIDMEQIILFPHDVGHDYIAKSFPGQKVLSAGFVDFEQDPPQCFGESISLGIMSRPKLDTELLNVSIAVGKNRTRDMVAL